MKDDIVFALYKDTVIGNKNEFRKKVKKYIKDIDVDNVFIRITNYQIETYGLTLSVDNGEETKQRYRRLAFLAVARRCAKKNYYKNKEVK